MNELGEVLKSGPVDKAVDLLHRLAGPMFDEFGAILADKARVYRAKNLVSTFRETERILREAGLPANAVPTRLLLPIMEASSVENTEVAPRDVGRTPRHRIAADRLGIAIVHRDAETAHTQWSATSEVICQETLRIFKEKERLTDGTQLVLWAFGARGLIGPKIFDVPASVYPDSYERLGLIRRNFKVKSYFDKSDEEVSSDVDDWYEFTGYAIRFLDACHGPRPAKSVDRY